MINSTTSSVERTEQALERARGNLTVFKQVLYRRYLRAGHLDLLDRALTQVSRYVETGGAGGIGRLVIEMPPRHGKTVTTSRFYPAWHLGRNPEHRVMLVSYGASLADKNSRAARNLIRSPYYQAIFPSVQLAADSRAVDSWDLSTVEGGVDALGIGGGATGKGAHILIIDDPVKNRAEAESETYRDRTWEAFTSDLYTRLEPGGAIVIMSTRWHMDDLTGRALQMEGEDWKRLRFPALAEDDDPLGRQEGDALWPARFPQDVLLGVQSALGSYEFASLYQQRPIARTGGLFDPLKIEIVDHAPELERTVRFYDLAVTKKTTSDYTAGVKLGRAKDGRIVVLDVWRDRRELPDIHEAIVQNALIDGAETSIRLEAEKAGVIELAFLLRDRRLGGHRIDAVPPKGDKYTRAGPFASRVNGGQVLMVRGAWNRAFLDELAVFPAGAHDDQVDAASGAYEMIDHQREFMITEAPSAVAGWRG